MDGECGCSRSGQTSEFTWPDLYQDRQRHLDGGSANRLVEPLIDRRLPFQLSGPIPFHKLTLDGLHSWEP